MVAGDQLLRQALGHIGIRAGVVALDQLQLDAGRQILLVLLDVEIEALLDLIAEGGLRTGIGQDDADLHGLRRARLRRGQ